MPADRSRALIRRQENHGTYRILVHNQTAKRDMDWPRRTTQSRIPTPSPRTRASVPPERLREHLVPELVDSGLPGSLETSNKSAHRRQSPSESRSSLRLANPETAWSDAGSP